MMKHLTDPLSYLQAMARLLKPGGRLLMTTPNSRGFSGRLLGPRWRVFAGEHLSYFDQPSLTHLLDRAGFSVDKLEMANVDIIPLVWGVRRKLSSLSQMLPRRAKPAPPATTAQNHGRL